MSNHYNESITEIMCRRRFLQQAGGLGIGMSGSLTRLQRRTGRGLGFGPCAALAR